jgi:beta-glucosidase-like glycosyl hydrolase
MQYSSSTAGVTNLACRCAISAFAEAGDYPPPRNNDSYKPWVPNCANDYLLQTKLRDEWNSSCFVQSDCCDSIDAVVGHGYTDTLEEVSPSFFSAAWNASC